MNHFKSIKEKYATKGPGANFDVRALNQLFMMEIKEGEGRSEKGDFSFYPNKGNVLITRDLFTGHFLTEEQAKVSLKRVQEQHRELLKRISVGADQIFTMNLHFRNVDIGKDAGNGRVESEGRPLVEGFLSYVTRAVEGIIVDDSEIKILSHDEKALAGLSAHWPRFALHPEINSFELKTKSALQEEILALAKKALNTKHEYNVKIAVVLRPALLRGQQVYIPALKVGLLSRPPGGGEKSELNGEAGEKFYVNLVKQTLNEELNNEIERRE